jgi:hypothetical protein
MPVLTKYGVYDLQVGILIFKLGSTKLPYFEEKLEERKTKKKRRVEESLTTLSRLLRMVGRSLKVEGVVDQYP